MFAHVSVKLLLKEALSYIKVKKIILDQFHRGLRADQTV